MIIKGFILIVTPFLLTTLSFSQTDSIELDELPYSFPMTIRYENNKAEISHINRIRLGVLAEYMILHPSMKILIEGHVCCGPQYRVSKRRARSVYKYLRRLEVPREQIDYVGRSFDEPKVIKERNEDDKNLNRRVEIELISR
jgi:outer membrane protein OmpA-like peptidoglycan-associated protein